MDTDGLGGLTNRYCTVGQTNRQMGRQTDHTYRQIMEH